jgi:Holliday junction resolvase RusA-like endonuclease
MTFDVPGPPVPWARARRMGNRYFVDEKTAAFKRKVALAAKNAGVVKIEKPHAVRLWLEFYLPRPKPNKTMFPVDRHDVDNLAKVILDAMNGVAFEDDGQVITLHINKRWSDPPSTRVHIERIDG